MRKHVENIFANLAKDDPFYGITTTGFLFLMKDRELEIVATVSNHAIKEKMKLQEAIDACYHAILGIFLDNFDDDSVFTVADALGADDDGLVLRDKGLQFIYCVLWNTWCAKVRQNAREIMGSMHGG